METRAISSFHVLARLFLAQVTAQGLLLSSALERYKYPGSVPGTFKQGLGFIFYLVAFRETYQGDQTGRGVHLVKPVSLEEN